MIKLAYIYATKLVDFLVLHFWHVIFILAIYLISYNLYKKLAKKCICNYTKCDLINVQDQHSDILILLKTQLKDWNFQEHADSILHNSNFHNHMRIQGYRWCNPGDCLQDQDWEWQTVLYRRPSLKKFTISRASLISLYKNCFCVLGLTSLSTLFRSYQDSVCLG